MVEGVKLNAFYFLGLACLARRTNVYQGCEHPVIG